MRGRTALWQKAMAFVATRYATFGAARHGSAENMAGIDLPRLVRQRGIRRVITLRPIASTKAQAAALAEILLRPVSLWQQAIPRIMAGYNPPARAGDALTTDALSDITAALEAVSGEVERFLVTITAQLGNWSMGMERWHRGKWASAVNGGTGIDLSMMLTAQPTQETLEAWLARNVALVSDVSAQTKGRIADIVFREWQIGTPPREVGKKIAEAVGLGRVRAKRIAADQALKLSSQLDAERQAEAGIEYFKYRHGGKVRYRPWHLARNGKIYDQRTLKQKDGTDKIEPDDAPGIPPFCSCLRQAFIPFLEGIE